MAILLGYDDDGVAVYYPPVVTNLFSWANHEGPYVWDLCTGQYLLSFVIADPDGNLNYLAPKLDDARFLEGTIAENQIIQDWADEQMEDAGYQSMNSGGFFKAGTATLQISLAYNFGTNTYDLIAFGVTAEIVGTLTVYTAGQAILITAGASVPLPDTFQQWIEGQGQQWLSNFLAHRYMKSGGGHPTPTSFDFRPKMQP